MAKVSNSHVHISGLFPATNVLMFIVEAQPKEYKAAVSDAIGEVAGY